jgi:hypothetical protein
VDKRRGVYRKPRQTVQRRQRDAGDLHQRPLVAHRRRRGYRARGGDGAAEGRRGRRASASAPARSICREPPSPGPARPTLPNSSRSAT